ncbi:TIMELESS-interacting protein isoform X4 [Osmerus eperlanus]|uniref:TIMELESS-interacting protein isoform X4 n=1 Tax=Osmerus eperlanus TaxID=29151 RepID=UPI002E0F69E3
MNDPLDNDLFDIPDFEQIEDESFPPLPPPFSPGNAGEGDPFANGELQHDVSKLAEGPAARRRGVKRPQPKLDSQRLTSERGLPALRNLFNNIHFKGKGHEVEDLHTLMQRMENWAHRLYPKLPFPDFIDKLETLGSKKEVQTCLKRIRLDMPITHEDFIGEQEKAGPDQEDRIHNNMDPFERFPEDALEQVPSTPVLSSPPAVSSPPALSSTPIPALSSTPALSEEQQQRIRHNKQLALEKRLALMQQKTNSPTGSQVVSSQQHPGGEDHE